MKYRSGGLIPRMIATVAILISLMGSTVLTASAAPSSQAAHQSAQYQAVDADVCAVLLGANLIDVDGNVTVAPGALRAPNNTFESH